MPGTNSYDTTSMNAKNSTRENTKQGKIKVRPLNRFLASFHQFKSTWISLKMENFCVSFLWFF